MSDPIQVHECSTPGLQTEGVVFELQPNHGKPIWKATAEIGSIFGAEVHGQIEARGKTKEIALERLAEERRKLYESLWA